MKANLKKWTERGDLFLRSLLNRNNITHAAFIGGTVWLAYGAEAVGESFGINGLGSWSGGLALMVYAYLLGQE